MMIQCSKCGAVYSSYPVIKNCTHCNALLDYNKNQMSKEQFSKLERKVALIEAIIRELDEERERRFREVEFTN